MAASLGSGFGFRRFRCTAMNRLAHRSIVAGAFRGTGAERKTNTVSNEEKMDRKRHPAIFSRSILGCSSSR
jgi:hypothetical protein